jgi:hypothetical protein
LDDWVLTHVAANKPQSFQFGTSDGKQYEIRAWKGEYWQMGDGGEVEFFSEGAYIKVPGTNIGIQQWDAIPNEPDTPKMSVRVSEGSGPSWSFAPKQPQPWVGAYNPAVTDWTTSDLHYTATVTFPNAAMYQAFERSTAVQQSDLWSFDTPNEPSDTAVLHY